MAEYLAVVATLLAAAIASWTVFRGRKPRRAILELVDVSFYLSTLDRSEWSHPRHPAKLVVADFALRNSGGQVLIIKRVDVSATHAYGFAYLDNYLSTDPPPPNYSLLELTADYDMVLPQPTGSPFLTQRVLTQDIRPGEADRFTLTLSGANPLYGGSDVYRCSFSLFYNSDEKVSTKYYILAIPRLPDHEIDLVRHRIVGFVNRVGLLRLNPPRGEPRPNVNAPLEAVHEYLEAMKRQMVDLRHVLKEGGLLVTGEDTKGLDSQRALQTVEATLGALPSVEHEARTMLQREGLL
jgi:hypothetical protein